MSNFQYTLDFTEEPPKAVLGVVKSLQALAKAETDKDIRERIRSLVVIVARMLDREIPEVYTNMYHFIYKAIGVNPVREHLENPKGTGNYLGALMGIEKGPETALEYLLSAMESGSLVVKV